MKRKNTTGEKSRNSLPEDAKYIREALLYADGSTFATKAEKLYVFKLIKTIEGTEWYTLKQHQSWCSNKAKELRYHVLPGPATPILPSAGTPLHELVAEMLRINTDPPFTALIQCAYAAQVPVETVSAEIIQQLLALQLPLLQ